MGINVERRKKFIKAMAENGGNATKAAIEAGVSEKSAGCTAVRLMKEKDVLDAIKETKSQMREIAAKNIGITQETKMKILWSHANESKPADSIKAIAELNKMTGDYEPAEIKSDITSGGESLSSVVILPENNRNINFENEEESAHENS